MEEVAKENKKAKIDKQKKQLVKLYTQKKKKCERRMAFVLLGERPTCISPLGCATAAPQEAPQWRQNIEHAKKTAWQALGVAMRMQAVAGVGNEKNRAPKRMDSFSFFISNLLGSDVERFQEESKRYQTAYVASEETRQLLAEVKEAKTQAELASIREEAKSRAASRPSSAKSTKSSGQPLKPTGPAPTRLGTAPFAFGPNRARPAREKRVLRGFGGTVVLGPETTEPEPKPASVAASVYIGNSRPTTSPRE